MNIKSFNVITHNQSIKFEYNSHGVCLNPEVVFKAEHKSHGKVEIRISELKGKWTWGYSYGYSQGGGGSGCSFCHKDSIKNSREEIIQYAIDRMKGWSDWQDEDGNYSWHLKQLTEWEVTRNQLTLF